MENSIIAYIDTHIPLLLALHVILSTVIAAFTALGIRKRFPTTSSILNATDTKRLQKVRYRSKIFQMLFKISLHKNNTKAGFAYFFIFNLSMPLLGYLASFWFMWELVHVEYDEEKVETAILNLEEFDISFLEVRRSFGEGSLKDMMKNQNIPQRKKLQALNLLAENLTPENLSIVRQTLSSKDDEVRMFGYSIINKAEKKLATGIHEELQKYQRAKKVGNTKVMMQSAKKLAFLYWEMLYTELSSDTLSDEFMAQVLHYATIARELYTQKIKELTNKEAHSRTALETLNELSRIHQLLGRAYMRQKNYDAAITEFTVAKELKADNSNFVLPYLAEIYFLLGRYHLVSAILSNLDQLEINATMAPVLQQWKRLKYA